MDIVKAVQDFLTQHNTVRRLGRNAVVAVAAFIVANAPIIADGIKTNLGDYASLGVVILYLVVDAIRNWLEYNTTLPVVGTKGKVPGTKK